MSSHAVLFTLTVTLFLTVLLAINDNPSILMVVFPSFIGRTGKWIILEVPASTWEININTYIYI